MTKLTNALIFKEEQNHHRVFWHTWLMIDMIEEA